MKILLNDKHEYFVDGVLTPGVTEILRDVGIAKQGAAPTLALERAGKFGYAVHVACQLWDDGVLDLATLSIPIVPYLEAWREFISDNKAQVVETERVVYSRKWGYCGTLDRVLKIKKRLVLVDIKTSAAVPAFTALQLVAYKVAWEEETKSKISARWCVHLCPGARYKIVEYSNQADEQVFKAAVLLRSYIKREGI